MINPSASGWIDKFFIKQEFSESSLTETDELFYNKVRSTGFIYGHIISFDTPTAIETKGWTKEEISKIALLNTLFGIYLLIEKNTNSEIFISKAVAFYNQMHPQGFDFFKKILPKSTPSITLEKIIDARVQTNESIISKNFSHLVTNALLFIDVLAFRKYLIQGKIPEKYLKKLEDNVVNIVTNALTMKTKKSQYDTLLIKLFEASLRFSKFSENIASSLDHLQLDYFTSDLEKMYLIDMAGMALWSDAVIEKEEIGFLHSLAKIMNFSDDFVNQSILDTNNFITTHQKDIPYFHYSNPVKHFYDQTTQSVITLITRNKKRLVKEIVQSKDLMILLANSTRRDLEVEEKKKIKKQLLDICKTIPSLTIFLLPGGSLLLPILIKFIPTLLPSSFNENLDNE